jgi:hypothetical protein
LTSKTSTQIAFSIARKGNGMKLSQSVIASLPERYALSMSVETKRSVIPAQAGIQGEERVGEFCF